jgi:hypothetical protein
VRFRRKIVLELLRPHRPAIAPSIAGRLLSPASSLSRSGSRACSCAVTDRVSPPRARRTQRLSRSGSMSMFSFGRGKLCNGASSKITLSSRVTRGVRRLAGEVNRKPRNNRAPARNCEPALRMRPTPRIARAGKARAGGHRLAAISQVLARCAQRFLRRRPQHHLSATPSHHDLEDIQRIFAAGRFCL